MKIILSLFVLSSFLWAGNDYEIRQLSSDAKIKSRQAVQQAGLEFFVPQLILGGEWTSTIRLTNKGSQPIPTSDILFIDDRGDLLQATFTTFPGNQTITDVGMSFTLAGNGILEVQLKGGCETRFGYALVDPSACPLQANCTLYGEVVLKNSNPTRPDFESVFPFENGNELQYLIWDHRNGFSTVLYLISANLSTNLVQLEFRDSQDNLTKVINKQMTDVTEIISLHAVAPETIGKLGTLVIRATNTNGDYPFVIATGLRINPSNSFTPLRAFAPKMPLAPTAPPVGGGGPSGLSFTCSAVEGALVYGNDGQFLGRITSNRFTADSLGNEYGRYGSSYSSTSIFNQYGKYGSQTSSFSAFNAFATTPPLIFVNERAVAYLTTNTARSPRVTPQQIYPCIGR